MNNPLNQTTVGGTQGDHNAFSKWLLNWTNPIIISSEIAKYDLNASSGASDTNVAYAIFPNLGGNRFSQFFLVENGFRVGNRSPYVNANWADMLSDGLLIWHIDATLNTSGTNFVYNNTSGARKLIRMMQADGQDDIETTSTGNVYSPDAGDLWKEGQIFDANTYPNSNGYENLVTGVTVKDISPSGSVMTASMGIARPLRHAPLMLGPSVATGVVGVLFQLPVRAEGGATSFSASGLPAGLRLDPIGGAILGVPSSAGSYAMSITAANEVGAASVEVFLRILTQRPSATLAGCRT